MFAEGGFRVRGQVSAEEENDPAIETAEPTLSGAEWDVDEGRGFRCWSVSDERRFRPIETGRRSA